MLYFYFLSADNFQQPGWEIVGVRGEITVMNTLNCRNTGYTRRICRHSYPF
jgi:hypothetical protein